MKKIVNINGYMQVVDESDKNVPNNMLNAFNSIMDAIYNNDKPYSITENNVAKECNAIFTSSVDFLRKHFPNEHIKSLMQDAWCIIGNKLVQVVLSDIVRTIAFVSDNKKASVLLPYNDFKNMYEKDRYYLLSGIIYACSQTRDFYNNKIIDPNVHKRAMIYEAEFWNTILNNGEKILMKDYSKGVIDKFPNGITGHEELFYIPKQTPKER